MGKKDYPSSYGVEGDGKATNPGTFKGMGPKDAVVMAMPDEAVMFVEVSYEYQPLVSSAFVGMEAQTIHVHAAFNVRDDRDLSQIYQRNVASPDQVRSCDKQDGFDDYYT